MKKSAWHTDIVVNGQGFNVKVTRPGPLCARMTLKPDVPGRKSKKAEKRFLKNFREVYSCSVDGVKRLVERAVKKTGARWNQWHQESY